MQQGYRKELRSSPTACSSAPSLRSYLTSVSIEQLGVHGQPLKRLFRHGRLMRPRHPHSRDATKVAYSRPISESSIEIWNVAPSAPTGTASVTLAAFDRCDLAVRE